MSSFPTLFEGTKLNLYSYLNKNKGLGYGLVVTREVLGTISATSNIFSRKPVILKFGWRQCAQKKNGDQKIGLAMLVQLVKMSNLG